MVWNSVTIPASRNSDFPVSSQPVAGGAMSIFTHHLGSKPASSRTNCVTSLALSPETWASLSSNSLSRLEPKSVRPLSGETSAVLRPVFSPSLCRGVSTMSPFHRGRSRSGCHHRLTSFSNLPRPPLTGVHCICTDSVRLKRR